MTTETSTPGHISPKQFRESEGVEDWRVLGDGANAYFRTGSLAAGAALIGAFVDQDQIDEFIIHVMPTLIGDGIPLLGPGRRAIQLSLRSCKHFSDGVVRLHYLVAKGTEGETKGKQRAV